MSDGGRADPARAEAEELRLLLKRLKEEAAANEQKWQRTLERELDLLRADTLPELLERITVGLADSYGLDAVQLVIEDPQHEVQHLMLGLGDRPEERPGVTFVDTLVGLAPLLATLRRPWLGSYVRADHELLFPRARALRSLALLPLRRQERTAAVLCFGSADPERFSHRLGADFLAHLASVVAICLENACNRARVLRSGLSDYLTGWHNRRYLTARLREELARAQRSGTSVACLMIDIDHFKTLNDTFGHIGGDEALREISARIESQIRASDTAARFGGDEFTLLLPDTSLPDAVRLAERIRSVMAAPIDVGHGRKHPVTLSIGAAARLGRRGSEDLKALAEALIADADAALYAAKAAGRDRVAAGGG
ncbi:MAG: sensor domain-containing diguanylate cyclase [Proteobacteria bacterium]|nr:sensor domain-containing diguanylate cyclase [Pseudomonadota bacterium]